MIIGNVIPVTRTSTRCLDAIDYAFRRSSSLAQMNRYAETVSEKSLAVPTGSADYPCSYSD